jgi:hypothetical protein
MNWTHFETVHHAKRGEEEDFLDGLSNSGLAIRLSREGRQIGSPEDRYRRIEKS